MKYLATLTTVLFFGNAFASAPTQDAKVLSQIVCQKFNTQNERQNSVLILEQLSDSPVSGKDFIDARKLTLGLKGEVAFSMKLFNESLEQDGKTKEEVIAELLRKEAPQNNLFYGVAQRQLDGMFFQHNSNKEILAIIPLKDLESASLEIDGVMSNYRCEKPMVIEKEILDLETEEEVSSSSANQ